VNLYTSTSGSQLLGNTKKDKIQQTPSSTKRNKIEAHPRTVRSSLRNKNCVVKTKNTASVQNSKLNVNFDLRCVTCNGCLFSDNHYSYVLQFINNVNARVKSKSVKKTVKRKVWKPTGKADIGIFIGYAHTKKAFRIYNRRTRRIIETNHVDFDKLTAMASKQSSSGPALHEMTPTTISPRLMPKPTSSTPFVPSSRTDWDLLFQPLFDKLLTPPPSVDHPAPEVIAQNAEVEVIEFGDSYEALTTVAATGSASEGTATKKGRTVTFTTKDMQKRKNDVKARTTLLMALPDEHQLRCSKYKTVQELWAAILKTFGGHSQSSTFMDIEIEQDDLNQKFLTSLAPEWLMHTIVWRNRSDLDTMSLDDLYNHLKVYKSEVQKKSESNSQNMAFISSAKNSSGKEDVNTTSIPTASTNVSPTSVNIRTKKTGKKISIQGTYVVGFDKSKVECFNYHKMGHFARECRAPRSQDMRKRDNYKQGSKVEEQAPKALMVIDGVGWDWSFMANEEEDHALVADEEAPTEFALMAKTSAKSK
nr:ribonuclease H-like domain-containing protein [Tanacetum cinerariifolium]